MNRGDLILLPALAVIRFSSLQYVTVKSAAMEDILQFSRVRAKAAGKKNLFE